MDNIQYIKMDKYSQDILIPENPIRLRHWYQFRNLSVLLKIQTLGLIYINYLYNIWIEIFCK